MTIDKIGARRADLLPFSMDGWRVSLWLRGVIGTSLLQREHQQLLTDGRDRCRNKTHKIRIPYRLRVLYTHVFSVLRENPLIHD